MSSATLVLDETGPDYDFDRFSLSAIHRIPRIRYTLPRGNTSNTHHHCAEFAMVDVSGKEYSEIEFIRVDTSTHRHTVGGDADGYIEFVHPCGGVNTVIHHQDYGKWYRPEKGTSISQLRTGETSAGADVTVSILFCPYVACRSW